MVRQDDAVGCGEPEAAEGSTPSPDNIIKIKRLLGFPKSTMP